MSANAIDKIKLRVPLLLEGGFFMHVLRYASHNQKISIEILFVEAYTDSVEN